MVTAEDTIRKVLQVRQEMLPVSWAREFLDAHEQYVRRVRKGEAEAPVINMDYGTSGPNPYGVGSSSLTKDVRQWWYGRKFIAHQETPSEYKFTAEQGRLMEQPVMIALGEMGIKFIPQVASATEHHGGFVDGLGYDEAGDLVLFESKHVGASRFLEMWYKTLIEANKDYFWQAQSYLEGTGAKYTQFVVTAQDSSSVKKELTNDKRFNTKRGFFYDHDNEPNTKVFSFRLYKLDSNEFMDERALGMMGTLQEDVPPARELNPSKDWQCMSNFCGWREQCLQDGTEGAVIPQLPDVQVQQVYLKEV